MLRVGVVVDYADTTMTTLTWTAIFGGLSSTLKEQSGEKKYMGVSTYSIAII